MATITAAALTPAASTKASMTASKQKDTSSNNPPDEQFPIKLHRILEEAEFYGFTDCISWMPDGTSFKIRDKVKLEKEVMPRYFTSCQFKSFQRSLNMWGYVADNQKSDAATGGGRRHHPLFVKGRPDLCRGMRRVRVKQPGTRGKGGIPPKTSASDEDQKLVAPTSAATMHGGRHLLPPALRPEVEAPSPLAQLLYQEASYDQGKQIATIDGLMQLSKTQPNALLNSLLAQTLLNAQATSNHQQENDYTLLAAALVKQLNGATLAQDLPLLRHPLLRGGSPVSVAAPYAGGNAAADLLSLQQATETLSAAAKILGASAPSASTAAAQSLASLSYPQHHSRNGSDDNLLLVGNSIASAFGHHESSTPVPGALMELMANHVAAKAAATVEKEESRKMISDNSAGSITLGSNSPMDLACLLSLLNQQQGRRATRTTEV